MDTRPRTALSARTVAGIVLTLLAAQARTAAQQLREPVFPIVGVGAKAIAVADLNGDGKLDVVTGNLSEDVSFLLADDACGWRSVNVHPMSDAVRALAVADLNHDGVPDVAAITTWSFVQTIYGNVTVLMSDGTGGVASSWTNGTMHDPRDLAIGDVTSDGHPDVVVVIKDDDEVIILEGDGAGGFGPGAVLAADGQPMEVELGDLNGDGQLDIVTGNRKWPGDLSVFLADGAGGFGPATKYQSGGYGWNAGHVKIHDFDHDGLLDLLAQDGETGNGTWLQGDGSGGFGPPTLLSGGNVIWFLADLTGNGELDIVNKEPSGNAWVTVQLDDGSHQFSASRSFMAGDYALSATVSDMNADGYPDLLVGGYEVLTVLTGDGTGTFPQVPLVKNIYGIEPLDGVFSDLNGDGDPDLSIADRSSKKIGSPHV